MALVLVFSITPSVFAEETVGGTTIYVDATNGDDTQPGVGTTAEKAYRSIGKAVKAAKSGDTIKLAEGNYSLYDVCGKKDTDNKEYTKNKDLTFIGAGPEETEWRIGPEVPDPKYYGTEYNSDYSFKGTGTITFKNMTLRSDSVDYLGFSHTNNTIVENCVINGKTFYWGYKTATFRNTTFNCPSGDYALWTYCSPVMTFEHCMFNSSGKVINVYNENREANYTIIFNNCTVNNTGTPAKQVLNINDSLVTGFTIKITGDTVLKGYDTENIVDDKTCSRLFGFGGKANTNNKGKTIVKFDDTTVWQNGKMVDAKAYHNSGVTADGVTYKNDVNGSNNSLYAEGYKDHAFDTTPSEWTTNADGKITRTVTKTCKYCGYQENVTEYRVTYYYSNGTAKPTDSPKTGDTSNLTLWIALLLANGGAVTATTIYGRKNKRSVK